MSGHLTPYANLPDVAFWRKAVASVPVTELDPVGSAPFVLSTSDRVATAGSCFAVHVSRHLSRSGYNYFATEPAHPFLGPIADKFGYGMFSARYGNIYTTRQLVQLFDRVYGNFQPNEDVWPNAEGRYFDPFRPNIQPNGFSSEREYWEDRQRHLQAVRQLFEQLDVFVFTLGLTEQWVSREDGAAYPVCPGVAAGTFDAERYEFHNLTCEEVIADLGSFIGKLRQVNPAARVILTVSPVPLIATMEPQHVLVSTTYSKSALRVACDAAVRRFDRVAYFPSYEIITASCTGGRYFAEDRRSVTAEGVDHVMKLFFRHYGSEENEVHGLPQKEEVDVGPSELTQLSKQVTDILCEEEMLDVEAASG